MSDVAPSTDKIQAEGLVANAPVSEATWQAMGGAINYLLNAFNPVGTIIHSMLTEAQLQAQMGAGWILADGRNVGGSTYTTLTGSAFAPDLRGRFLRGKNHARSTATGDSSGDYALGTEESDQTAQHNHSLVGSHNHGLAYGTPNSPESTYGIVAQEIFPGTLGYAANGGLTNALIDSVTSGNTANAGSGPETRPRATVVNIFIRIN